MVDFTSPHDHVLPRDIRFSPPPKSPQTNYDVRRFIGSIVGLAVGDALGASVEFRPHEYFVNNPVQDMHGGGTWGLKAGQWTDDTSMALCLAASLISRKCYDPYDQMVRYKWWYKYGYLSSTGQCFDIGNATRDSLEVFIGRQNSLTQSGCKADDLDYLTWDQVQSIQKFEINCSYPGVAGNGALMRLAPVPLFFYQTPSLAVEYAGRSARLTHGDEKAVDACRYYAALIVAAVRNESKEDILNNKFYENHLAWFGKSKLDKEILRIAKGSYKCKNGYDGGIRGKGYIVNALEAALWAFWSDGDSFKTGALAAVNLGDDTDTTAAIYGQLAGAFYGYDKIPQNWLSKLYAPQLLIGTGEWLHFQGSQSDSSNKEPLGHQKGTVDYPLPTHPPNTQPLPRDQPGADRLPAHPRAPGPIQAHAPNQIPVPRHRQDVQRSPEHSSYLYQSGPDARYTAPPLIHSVGVDQSTPYSESASFSQTGQFNHEQQLSKSRINNAPISSYRQDRGQPTREPLNVRQSLGNQSNPRAARVLPTEEPVYVDRSYNGSYNATQTRSPVNTYSSGYGNNSRDRLPIQPQDRSRVTDYHNNPPSVASAFSRSRPPVSTSQPSFNPSSHKSTSLYNPFRGKYP